MYTKSFVIAAVAALSLVALPFGSTWAETTDGHKKVKVLYHVDGKDPEQVRKDAEKSAGALQIKLPAPAGSDGPENLQVSSDFKSIAAPSVETPREK